MAPSRGQEYGQTSYATVEERKSIVPAETRPRGSRICTGPYPRFRASTLNILHLLASKG